MGALGLGYLDTPVIFWAAQLPGGLGADQTRPEQAGAEGEERAGRLGGEWETVRMTSKHQGQRAGGWGPQAPQVLYRGYWVPTTVHSAACLERFIVHTAQGDLVPCLPELAPTLDVLKQ